MQATVRRNEYDRRVAVLLWLGWSGGMLRNAFTLAKLIAGQPWDEVGRVEVVLGIRGDGEYSWSSLQQEVDEAGPGISIRRLDIARIGRSPAARMFSDVELPDVSLVTLPRDGVHDFLDCDAWITFSGSTEGYVPPVRPTAVYCADQVQRYIPRLYTPNDPPGTPMRPGISGDLHETYLGWRHARTVFATTPQTLEDVVGFAGVRRAQTLLVPTLVQPVPAEEAGGESPITEPSIVWVTNGSLHKNHANAIESLRIYYDELGGALRLVVMGESTSTTMDPTGDSQTAAARALRAAPSVARRTTFLGRPPDRTFHAVIRGAAVVWHNVIIDNGTFVAFDAARGNRHLVSSDYPQMRYLCERYGIDAFWHPSGDPRAAAQALLDAERAHRSGGSPAHALREDAPAELESAYGTVIRRIASGLRRGGSS